MPKLKTHRGAAKRFRRTATGFKRKQTNKNHILTKKAPQGLGARKFDEHNQIKDAALAHDVDKAIELIEHHIRDTSERIVPLL